MVTNVALAPIETVWQGWRFRSRLEARWAVFFTALNLGFIYEMEGFDLGAAGWYLPDFWLPLVKMWGEVKPVPFDLAERHKCAELSRQSGYPCLLLVGVPAMRSYWAILPTGELIDFAISNYHGCPQREYRFWASLGFDETDERFGIMFGDMEDAANGAKATRFEHAERSLA